MIASRGWKPLTPWKITARRGFGEAYVTCTYTEPTYEAACYKRSTLLLVKPPRGVPPWDSVEICEGVIAPRRSGRAQKQTAPRKNAHAPLKGQMGL